MKIYTTTCRIVGEGAGQFLPTFTLDDAKQQCQMEQADIEDKPISQATQIEWKQEGNFCSSVNFNELEVEYEIVEWEVELPES